MIEFWCLVCFEYVGEFINLLWYFEDQCFQNDVLCLLDINYFISCYKLLVKVQMVILVIVRFHNESV